MDKIGTRSRFELSSKELAQNVGAPEQDLGETRVNVEFLSQRIFGQRLKQL